MPSNRRNRLHCMHCGRTYTRGREGSTDIFCSDDCQQKFLGTTYRCFLEMGTMLERYSTLSSECLDKFLFGEYAGEYSYAEIMDEEVKCRYNIECLKFDFWPPEVCTQLHKAYDFYQAQILPVCQEAETKLTGCAQTIDRLLRQETDNEN